MTTTQAEAASTFELPFGQKGLDTQAAAGKQQTPSLPWQMLLENAAWFCSVRWVVAGILVIPGVLGLIADLIRNVSPGPHTVVPLSLAAILAAYNLAVYAHVRHLKRSRQGRGVLANLWIQIFLDLLMVTVIVHYMGSQATYAAFAYFFHIVLACVLLSRRQSLEITLLACGLYLACIALELAGGLPVRDVFADQPPVEHLWALSDTLVVNVISVPAILLVVWALTSRLAAMIRQQNRDLEASNSRLIAALHDRAREMLHATRELRAPFAAVHANMQLLMEGKLGDLSPVALEAVAQSSAGCGRLAREMQEMLQLARLRWQANRGLHPAKVDVADVLRRAVDDVQHLADEHQVTLEADLVPAASAGVDDHLEMLFTNLLANAVIYSDSGSTVRVQCGPSAAGNARVVIQDHGMGIPADKLPRIFDEFYRTNEAAARNKQSSGLGLTIVSHVAESHGIDVHVASQTGQGTTFELQFPPA